MPQTSLQTLQHLGLTDKEARVYTASLELGSAPVQIIALKADINRPTAYVVIDNLLKMGLMTRHEQGKKTLYAAEPPERLERLIERQHESLVEREAELKSIFPALKALFNLSENKPVIKYYEGRAGQLAMMREYYAPQFRNSTIYAFAPFEILNTAIGPNLMQEMAKRRVGLGIRLKLIYAAKRPVSGRTDPKQLREARFIPVEKYPFAGDLVIQPEWGFWIYNYARGFQALAVGDKEMAKTLKAFFDLAWQAAKPSK